MCKLKLLILVLIPHMCMAQEELNASTFFKISKTHGETDNQAAEDKITFPWIEEYELRTETRSFNFPKQEYTFRLKPSTPKKRQAQSALYKHLLSKPDIEALSEICSYKLQQHEDWLSLYIIQESLIILNHKSDILNDRQTVYEKLVASFELDLEKLVELHTEKSDLKLESSQLELEKEDILIRYSLSNRPVSFENFISIDDIENLAQRIFEKAKMISAEEFIFEKELNSMEIDLERAEERQIVDFAQIRYRGPHNDDIQDRISLGLGLRLATSGNRKIKILELEQDLKEIEREKKREERAFNETLELLSKALIADIRSYRNYLSTISEERRELKKLGLQIAQSEDYSPLVLLDIEERHIETTLSLIKKKENVYKTFLKFVDRANLLCDTDSSNYLSSFN